MVIECETRLKFHFPQGNAPKKFASAFGIPSTRCSEVRGEHAFLNTDALTVVITHIKEFLFLVVSRLILFS